jgi:hypothetical protein
LYFEVMTPVDPVVRVVRHRATLSSAQDCDGPLTDPRPAAPSYFKLRSSERVPFDVNQMRTIQIDTTDIYSLVPRIDSYRAEVANQVIPNLRYFDSH